MLVYRKVCTAENGSHIEPFAARFAADAGIYEHGRGPTTVPSGAKAR